QNGGSYQSIAPASCANPVCFSFGYDSTRSPRDNGTTYASCFLHGNYDFVTRSQHWDASTADHTIPASLYLASRPAWFANLAWPPFDPAVPASAVPASIPAGYRYAFGTNPPAGPVNLPPTARIRASVTQGAVPLTIGFS